MPGETLSSGTNFNLFLVRLVYKFHLEKMKAKVPRIANKATDVTSDINEGDAT